MFENFTFIIEKSWLSVVSEENINFPFLYETLIFLSFIKVFIPLLTI